MIRTRLAAKVFVATFAVVPVISAQPLVGDWPSEPAACRPVPLRAVRLHGFLGEHVDTNNRKSIPAGLDSPIPAAFEARAAGIEPPAACRRLATDSDFYKWLEGACYALAYDPTLTQLAERVDHFAAIIARMQEPDGYLGTRISPAHPFDADVRHDLYVAGHLIEAAVAHHKATGRRTLLDVATRLADYYINAYEQKHPYFETVGRREHPEIELALVRLYRATGERRYLDFAATIAGLSRIGPRLEDVQAGGGARHAVRLCYLMTGLSELYLATGDEAFCRHLPALWDETVSTRMYLTGGIGYNETIPAKPFDLPQWLPGNRNRDIAETCASVAFMMWSWRMHAMTADSRPFDVIETILYNHYLGAISRDHLGNFYYNPLRRVGDMTGRTDHGADPARRLRLPEIHSTACCLPNAWRFFAQLPEYVFSTKGDTLLVNLYTGAEAEYQLPDGTNVRIRMKTSYPHDGRVEIELHPQRPAEFGLALRIPGWCEGATVVAGGNAAPVQSGAYHEIRRQWQPGDRVVLALPMSPVVLVSRPEVEANRGQVAFRRGPLVYCLEREDAAGLDLAHVAVSLDNEDPSRSVRAVYRPELGMYVLQVRAGERVSPTTRPSLYYPAPPAARNIREITLVPFYFRANRTDDARWITFIPR